MSDQFELQEGKPLRERDAGELTAPIKERAERASARAKQKVTAEDLVRRHEERAERRARDAQERREKRAGWVRTGTGIALLLTAGVTLFVTNGVRVQSAATEAENHAVITEMRDEIAYLEQLTGAEDGEDVDQAPQVEDVQATLDKVRTIATEVADLQNQFPQIVAADPVDPGNGAPSQGFLNAVEHRRTLEPYFAKDTFLVDESEIYTPTSTFGLAVDQIDPRMQWYERRADAGSYSWNVVSVVGSEALDVSQVDVVWLAQDDATGELLAWATGSWSRDAEAFTKLTVGTTAYGDAQSATSQVAVEEVE